MTSAIGQSRSDDIGTLKTPGLDILDTLGLKDHEKADWAVKKISYKVQARRCLYDSIGGRLLCPRKLSKVFEEDPDG